ncbi:Actin,gamma [Alternaria alternata]|nr:Actin,gamma [Alternaria alternata]
MVTRSADDGSCELSESALESRLMQPWLIRRRWRYLRKTARGASSPAKPALHIPELSTVSSSSFHLCPLARCCGRVRRGSDKARARIAPPQQGWRCWASAVPTHPLSMTRAATSSVVGNRG